MCVRVRAVGVWRAADSRCRLWSAVEHCSRARVILMTKNECCIYCCVQTPFTLRLHFAAIDDLDASRRSAIGRALRFYCFDNLHAVDDLAKHDMLAVQPACWMDNI
jgi:hypothetical protein